MSTFLQLCADLTRESGAIGTAPAAVTGQSGRQLKCVEWIAHAWVLIQNLYEDWYWMQGEVTAVALTINDMSYTSADLGIATRFAAWKGDRPVERTAYYPWTIYDNAIGQSDEMPLREIPYAIWRTRYDRGSHDAQRPIEYALAPDGTIRFGPKPDKAYRVRGEYRKSAQVLAANGDTPELPERFHQIITRRAEMLMASADRAPDRLQTASMKYADLLFDLERSQLPAITTSGAGPIA
jgi:hypothetical protein